MRARFDDLRPSHAHSFGFDGLVDEIAAHDVAEVAMVLDRAEAAARAGHWVAGFVAYEAAPAFDDLTVASRLGHEPGGMLPLAWFGVFERRVDAPDYPPLGSYALGEWTAHPDRRTYESDVEAIREHIRQGDTYQVNYSMRLRAAFSGDPLAFYKDLGAAQSGGYGAYLDTGRYRVLSASPELFFERRGGRVRTRPMKGTIRRGLRRGDDLELRDRLVASVKDRAENVMIVDLLRNDLGRVAEFGSVEVEALFEPERYDTVWQLTSTVSARVGDETSAADLFGALFPCGSITGAPKKRTMEIIAERERVPRGVYCGAIGYLAPSPAAGPPEMAFSVAIRTVVVDVVDGHAEYGTGGGITYDSSPAGEYEEAMVKAAVLTRARAQFRLLETMRWDPGEGIRHGDRHLSRLADSADYFGIELDLDEVRSRLSSIEGPEPRLVRLLVTRSAGIEVQTAPLVERFGDPVTLTIDELPVDATDPFLYHKTTNRSVYDDRRVRHPGVDEVLMVNERGDVTEGAVTNLLARIDGVWCTPPIESGLLGGIGRSVLLDGGDIVERRLSVSDVEGAEALDVVNSVRGRRRAKLV